ncbi:hypothetical protein VDG1235_31 [Verrucomicrobiia bacterium DG1235]|nr:hypothetical protein VDG1235_31 [Verrucomicrobiae bacterium DG1235]
MIHLKTNIIRFAGLLLLGQILGLASTLQAQVLHDDSLRANYLIRFVDFVRFERPTNEPTTLAVLGSNGLYQELSKLAEKKKASGRDFRIIEINASDSLENIDLVYVGTGYKEHWKEVIDKARVHSVVTVCDEPGFLDTGGLIEFLIQKNRLRFSLNLEESDAYKIGVSSKLMQLSVR